MKHLQRGLVASAAGLLLTVGLATGASAAPTDCTVTLGPDVAQPEGDTQIGNDMIFVVTISDGPGTCTGGSFTYDATSDTAKDGQDFAGGGQTVQFTGAGTTRIAVPIIGDNDFEPDETFKVTIAPIGGVKLAGDGVAVGTIQNDDTIAKGGTATIDPASGPSETTITVTGTKCNATNGGAELIEVKGESGGPIASGNTNTVSNGTFTATLTVPAGADPSARQFVRAFCGAQPNSGNDYTDVAFDVTPARAGGARGEGYRMVAADGGVFTFGDRDFHGSLGDRRLNKPIVGGATNPATFNGYWMVASDGGVFTFGDAGFFGALGDQTLGSPIVEIEPTPSGKGYFLVDAKGQVFPFGDAAKNIPDARSTTLNKSVIGMTVTPSGQGYFLVASDGGIFTFGDAKFFGSTGDLVLNAPVIDLAGTPDGQGYYLVAADGGIFTFGNAVFKGSTGDIRLNKPAVAMLVNPTGSGYWIMASDGGVFTFGAVPFLGSTGNITLNSPILDAIN